MLIGQLPSETRPVDGVRRAPPREFVLEGADVVIRPGQTVSGARVVISGERIQAVGPDVAVPAGARVIDVSGKRIYAGFVDAYAETELAEAASPTGYWNSRVTPERRVVDEWERDETEAAAWRKQGVVARLMAPKGGLLKGQSALVSLADVVTNRAIVRAQCAHHVRLSPARRRGQGYPGSPMGAVALVRQALLDTQWYAKALPWAEAHPLSTPPESNAALEALMDEELPLIVDAPNERYFMRADRLGKEFDRQVIVRGSGREYRRLAEIAATHRAVLLPVDFPKAPDVSTPEATLSASLERLLHWDCAPDNPRHLAEAGVSFAFSGDGLQKSSEFLSNIRLAVRRGLNEETALAALTTQAAEILGASDVLGTLEPGKRASLVITDGKLFAKKTKILETWVDGRRYRHVPAETTDLRGEWVVTFDGPTHSQRAGELTLSGSDPRKLKGKLSLAKDEFDLKGVRWDGHRLSFQIDAQAWKMEGRVAWTVVISGDQLTREWMLGSGLLPDGEAVNLRMRQVRAAGDAEESDVQDAEAEDASDREGDEAQDEASAEDTESAASPSADDTDAKQEVDAKRDTEAKKKKPSSELRDTPCEIAIHYPLGANGRDALPTQEEVVAWTHATVWTCGPQGMLKGCDRAGP